MNLLPVQEIDLTWPGAYEVEGKRSCEKAHSAHDPCSKWHHQGWRAKRPGDPKAVNRPCPAKSEYWEAMRIFAALQRMDACGICHTLVRDVMDAPGSFFKRDP